MDTSEPLSATSPLIFNLHNDILLHIFHLNTYQSEGEFGFYRWDPTPSRPLNVARHSSQVCRAWRQTILESPAIWGRILDMTVISAGSEMWADEVLKRTGEARLSIYGNVGTLRLSTGMFNEDWEHKLRITAFFESMLTENWNRVRVFDITMGDHYAFDTALLDIIFFGPAPQLEKFHLSRDTTDRAKSLSLDSEGNIRQLPGPVFANFAPLIRRVHCTAYALGYSAVWSAQLVSMTLSDPLNITDVLAILSTTFQLEWLFIRNINSTKLDDAHGETTVHLPRLRMLYILGDVTQSLLVLRNIMSHPGCAISVATWNDKYIHPHEMDELARVVAPYVGRYLDLYRPPRLFVRFDHVTFCIESNKHTDMVYFDHPVLRISFEIKHSVLDPGITSLTPTAIILAAISFGSINELELGNCLHPSAPKFLAALSSVQTLIVEQDTLSTLVNQHLDVSKLFPLLETVRIGPSSGSSDTLWSDFKPNLLLFLTRRRAAQVPVSTLDLRNEAGTQNRFDWIRSFLDVFVGLKVVYRKDSEEVEYVCGSGEQAR